MILLILLITLALVVLLLLLRRRRRLLPRRQSITVRGVQRSFVLHDNVDRNRKVPLWLCFHGGLGNARRVARQTGLVEAGAKHGFAVVFPEAPGGWIDSRPERGGSPRDLEFVDALLDFLLDSGRYDAERVYAVGVSNGGLFVFRLALEQPDRFAGFAAVLACMPVDAVTNAPPGPPAPMVLVNGQSDHMMPWTGGHIAQGPGMGVGGEVVSAEETCEFWLDRNYANDAGTVRRMTPGMNAIEIHDYPAGAGGCPVRFVAIQGWGHRWPRWGGQWQGQGDFNAADLILEFFTGQAADVRRNPSPRALGDDHAGSRQHHL